MLQSDGARGGPRWAAAAAVVVALLALVGTAVAADNVRARDRESARLAFQSRSNAAVSVARQEVGRYTTALHATGSFAANAGTDDPAALTGYVASTDLFAQLPTMTSLLVATRVAEADVAALVAEMQPYVPGFQIIDLGHHEPGTDRWILTTYIPGPRDFRIPLGIDLTSLPALGAQAQRVVATGRTIAASFRLSPEMDTLSGALLSGSDPDVLNSEFFLEVPSYTGSPDDGQPPSRMVIAAVRGFAESVATAANLQFEDLGFRLTVDLDGLGMPIPAASSEVSQLDGRAGPLASAVHSTQSDFDVDGVRWTLTSWRGSSADDQTATPWLVLGFGTLSSLLLGWAMWLRTRSAQRARLLRQERAERARFQEDIVQSVADAMVIIDRHGAIVVGNRAWAHLMDRADTETGADYLDTIAARAGAATGDLVDAVRATLDGSVGESSVIDVPLTVDGTLRWFAVRASAVRDGHGGAVLVHSDITDRRHEQDSLVEQARRDPLTGLANRDAFAIGFSRALDEGRPFALLYVDLDRFKQINDRFGHRAGDQVLVATAERIRGAARADDVVARLGGDEFALLIGAPDEATAAAVAAHIEGAVARPVVVGDLSLTTSASVGVALVDPARPDTLDQAMERADRAMYAAKQRTRNAGRPATAREVRTTGGGAGRR